MERVDGCLRHEISEADVETSDDGQHGDIFKMGVEETGGKYDGEGYPDTDVGECEEEDGVKEAIDELGKDGVKVGFKSKRE